VLADGRSAKSVSHQIATRAPVTALGPGFGMLTDWVTAISAIVGHGPVVVKEVRCSA